MAAPRPNALAWLGLSAVLVVVDQWSKWLAMAKLEYGKPVPFIEGFWNWTLVHNYGAAFSFLSNAGGWQRWFFTVLAFGISAGLVVWLARTPRSDWRTALPFALVIAGAIGNVIDRIRFGYVVDFVDWYAGTWHWPAFNVADSAIVVGAVLMVLFSFRSPAAAGKGG
ncbi:lipoprotein signal peptidase [Arenimonas soli]|uniref:Lipoprotein signal peptidase n=2 Tax=Arenimonas soli TaxID=2269504 RepID=A0ABQ1HDH3_9GAMM|nr:lipoprotein signal peptidase [Arenimonas soli]